jgi:hypothetical protein
MSSALQSQKSSITFSVVAHSGSKKCTNFHRDEMKLNQHTFSVGNLGTRCLLHENFRTENLVLPLLTEFIPRFFGQLYITVHIRGVNVTSVFNNYAAAIFSPGGNWRRRGSCVFSCMGEIFFSS